MVWIGLQIVLTLWLMVVGMIVMVKMIGINKEIVYKIVGLSVEFVVGITFLFLILLVWILI